MTAKGIGTPANPMEAYLMLWHMERDGVPNLGPDFAWVETFLSPEQRRSVEGLR